MTGAAHDNASRPAPRDVAHAMLRAMEKKDYAAALSFISDDCEYENMPMGKVQGADGVRAVLEPFFEPTLANELKVQHEASAGPLLFMERLDRHQLADRWVELPVTSVMEVEAGKIVRWREYWDSATLARQWPGLLPGT